MNDKKYFLLTHNYEKKWTKVCQWSSEKLEESYITPFILALSAGNGGIMIYIEALRQDLVCVLMQMRK